MPQKHTFTATIIDAGGGGAFVEVPFDVEAAFGSKRPKVEADVEERVATVPAELKRAFKSDKEAKSAFEKLSYTHQKEYVKWIEEAKKAETRARRVEQTIQLLKERLKGR